jgi:hypothetical protein
LLGAGVNVWAGGTAIGVAAPSVNPITLSHIRDAALTSNWAWHHLADLTDKIGPRLSGSSQLSAAVTQVADGMRALGADVTLQAVKVPHWVRGEEEAELVDYQNRPVGVTQRLRVTALGGSTTTAAAGLTARVIVVHNFNELKARAQEVRGNIVLFDSNFDQRLADSGYAMDSYEQAGHYRVVGPSAAAELGAVGALVRSIGGANYRLPHTGLTTWKDDQVPIPAGALAAEDADLVTRLADQGPVTIRLVLTPKTLPDADSNNVIADWAGREQPGQYVIVSGHLDSWDLATGATDDGVGVIAAAAVIDILHVLNIHARRTIRFVGWTNEENGRGGSKAYFAAVSETIETQIAAIESDSGAGRPLGIAVGLRTKLPMSMQYVIDALTPIGASTIAYRDGELGSDIALLQKAGVPSFAPLIDTRHYFDYHHSAADTLDKVDPQNLRSQVATLAVLAYYLAEMREPLPR